MKCSICMYFPDEPHEAEEAITVIRGYAVCSEHMSYVAAGDEWSIIMRAVRNG